MMCFETRWVYNPLISFEMFKQVVLKVLEARIVNFDLREWPHLKDKFKTNEMLSKLLA
jgi:hypothetical protein